MKKRCILICLLLLFVFFGATFCKNDSIFAEIEKTTINNISQISETQQQSYNVCDESGNYLFSRTDVCIDDVYIDKNYNCYQVYLVDKEYKIAYAKIIEKIVMPKIKKLETENVSNNNMKKNIGLYMTHNDESYVIGDSTDSIYGKGGIHDIARQLKDELTDLGVNVTLDETLHIPHNSSAYSRSQATAQKLIDADNDCIFDIHRDGVARSAYITKYGGKEKCQVRIVVGQANPNKEQNLKLALYLMAVANETYPWLFADIYYAKGHYNQAMSNKMLLFEVGTYLAEKSLVEQSVPALARTINTTLYNSVIDQDGNIIINGEENKNQQTVNNILADNRSADGTIVTVVIVTLVIVSVFIIGFVLVKKIN